MACRDLPRAPAQMAASRRGWLEGRGGGRTSSCAATFEPSDAVDAAKLAGLVRDSGLSERKASAFPNAHGTRDDELGEAVEMRALPAHLPELGAFGLGRRAPKVERLRPLALKVMNAARVPFRAANDWRAAGPPTGSKAAARPIDAGDAGRVNVNQCPARASLALGSDKSQHLSSSGPRAALSLPSYWAKFQGPRPRPCWSVA